MLNSYEQEMFSKYRNFDFNSLILEDYYKYTLNNRNAAVIIITPEEIIKKTVTKSFHRREILSFLNDFYQINPNLSYNELTSNYNLVVGFISKDVIAVYVDININEFQLEALKSFVKDVNDIKEVKETLIASVNVVRDGMTIYEGKLLDVISYLEKKGVVVDIIDMKYLDTAVNLYQIIAMAEASSNLARFDGVRYGFRASNVDSVDSMYAKTRGEGFGDEVKRRIMVGSYILSGENARIYYDKALKVRDDITKEFNRIFKDYDLIIGPTTTRVAPLLGTSKDDPHKAFMDDVLVIPVNMAGLPGLNVPIGTNSEDMPIGLHIIGKAFDEATIYRFASFIEEVKR